MNSKQIGKANEKRTEKWLLEKGFIVHTVQQNTASYRVDAEGKYMPIRKKNMSQDLFGLWDHIAINPEDMSIFIKCDDKRPHEGVLYVYKDNAEQIRKQQVIFIQTKSQRQSKANKEKYHVFPGMGFLFIWIKQENGRYPKEPIIERVS